MRKSRFSEEQIISIQSFTRNQYVPSLEQKKRPYDRGGGNRQLRAYFRLQIAEFTHPECALRSPRHDIGKRLQSITFRLRENIPQIARAAVLLQGLSDETRRLMYQHGSEK